MEEERMITDHMASSANNELKVYATDQPGSGGANHRYEISGYDSTENKSSRLRDDQNPHETIILFQNGPIPENGVNGITGEALLAIQIDRLRGFQSGPFACRENAIALTHLETAMLWLKKRTYDRIARGVEGTHQA